VTYYGGKAERTVMVEGRTSARKLDASDIILVAFSHGIKLSKINSKFKDTIDIRPLLGKCQQLGLVKIIYNPTIDEEPLVQLTEKGKQQAIELLFSP
jgi:hypothetical protein